MGIIHSKAIAKPFPTRSIWIYMGVQLLLGVIFSILDVEDSVTLKKLLIPLENNLATFRTAFVPSQTPVASKIFLAVWWVAIMPWGLVWFYRFSKGLNLIRNANSLFSYTKLISIFLLAMGCTWMFISLLSFHDHSYYFSNDKLNSLSRGDLVPMLLSNGCFTMSIWLSISSFMLNMCMFVIFLFPRIFINKFFESKSS